MIQATRFLFAKRLPCLVRHTRWTSTLRGYQSACVKSILDELEKKQCYSLATSIATGGGKTVIFCSMIPQLLKVQRYSNDAADGVLILVHRKELAFQTINTLKRFKAVDEDRIFLDMGSSKASREEIEADSRPFVIVGSVPSISRASCERMNQYPIQRIHSIIVDECHHAVSDSYLAIFNRFDTEGNKPFILGFSATLQRKDKLPLKKVFTKIIYEKRIDELVQENYLCDLKWEKVNVGLDLSDVKVTGGTNSDYVLDSLADHVNTDQINELVLKAFIKLTSTGQGKMKSVLAFCVNVEHMRNLTELFQLNGINAQYVSGTTSAGERDSIVADFRNGKIKVLFNCGVFTEGTDIPNIDCILLLRPTKSKPLLTQMIGRGLRLHKDKSFLKVIDFVDNQSLGLTFRGTLQGRQESLLAGTASSGTDRHHKSYDEFLPSDIDYIKFTHLKGIQDLVNSKTQSVQSELRSKVRAWNATLSIPFIAIRYNLWASEINSTDWCELYVKDKDYVLDKVSKWEAFGTKSGRRFYQKRTNLIQTRDFEQAQAKFATSIVNNSIYSEIATAYGRRKHAMSHARVTDNQAAFLTKKLCKIAESQGKTALDLRLFANRVADTIGSLTKWQASELIFSYTIGQNSALEHWIRTQILNTARNRALVTSRPVLDHSKSVFQNGW